MHSPVATLLSWLKAREVRFAWQDSAGAAQKLLGWHSEHVNEAGRLHPWETSQVVEFLLSYRRALLAHLGRTSLILSGLSIREPDLTDKRKKKWSTVVASYDPATEVSAQIYQSIDNRFVAEWKRLRPKAFSMLLYGPPGTGKTTVAENIADHLGFRLITITVSDFLSGGADFLERNAKAIFDVLGAQTDCVILFDEIDSFLLDRDFKRHEKQETAFQFMTPSMLTKLNDLRRAKRSIFVLATNYETRIDAAIKRNGRIDVKYLVLPPDKGVRRRILSQLIKRHWQDHDVEKISEQEWVKLEKSSLFLGYRDMEAEVAANSSVAALASGLESHTRTTKLEPYSQKFESNWDSQLPKKEFLAMVKLALEVDDCQLPFGAPSRTNRFGLQGLQSAGLGT